MNRYPIAYQLYSFRNFPPLKAQLPTLKVMGYDAIEPWLLAYEADPPAFRRALDAAGLTCFGLHMPLDGLMDDPDRSIDIALTLGTTTLIPPWIDPARRQNSATFWSGIGHALAKGAERSAKHDLTVAWHNHNFEFHALPDGSRPIDHILAPEVRIPRKVGTYSRRSWALVPRHPGQPFHAKMGSWFDQRFHGVRLGLTGQGLYCGRRLFACFLR